MHLYNRKNPRESDTGLPKGMRYENGQIIDMDSIVSHELEHEAAVWVILKEDLAYIEDDKISDGAAVQFGVQD